MDFQLTDEQKMLQEQARQFSEREILPHWQRLRKKEFPRDIFAKMVEAGYAGATIPEEYGGGGLDLLSFAIVVIELCRADAGAGLSTGASLSLVAKPIEVFGNDEQKRFWLPKIASGKVIGAYAQTEPDHGSNVAGIQTKAVRDGNELVISGTKRFITNGSIADVVLVLAKTETHADKPHKGLSFILVDAKAAREAGTLIIDRDWDKMGLHCSPTSDLTFDKCRVPASNIVGEPGLGWWYAMGTLIGSRAMIAAQGVGIAEAAFEEALKYTLQREQFEKKLAEFQVMQRDLARMQMEIEAARLLTYQAAWLTQTLGIFRSEEFAEKTSFAKLYSSEVAARVAEKALVMHGGVGYMAETRISALYQDAIVLQIYEGASNIQEYIIARQLLRKHGIKI